MQLRMKPYLIHRRLPTFWTTPRPSHGGLPSDDDRPADYRSPALIANGESSRFASVTSGRTQRAGGPAEMHQQAHRSAAGLSARDALARIVSHQRWHRLCNSTRRWALARKGSSYVYRTWNYCRDPPDRLDFHDVASSMRDLPCI